MSIDNQNLQENEIDAQNMDLQARQIAGLLDEHAKRLSMRTLKQLENGRERAVKVHAQQTLGSSMNRDGTLSVSLSSISAWAERHRIASTGLVFAAIIASFIVMQSLNNKESSDAFLLSADLPPEAFVDRGFEPSLNDKQAKL